MTNTHFTEHPPVPQVLQEALKDYPELIAQLQDAIADLGIRPGMSREQRTDQFEMAIGSLEGGLNHFVGLAAAEVRAAEATGDAALIAKAKEKKMLMSGCCGRRLRQGYAELSDFFRVDQD
ncbi:MAG: hypothetical protein AB1455_04445 [Pseudomonadota bacterium]